MKTNLLKKYSKSFYWASFFLSSEIYNKSLIIYNYCRTLDDIADLNPEFFNELYKNEQHKQYAGKNSKEILSIYKTYWRSKNDYELTTKAMYNLFEKEKISRKIVEDLFDGLESDCQEKIQLDSKKLLIYCYRVAGTVGLMMSKILKVNDRNSIKGAIDLGIAMQLTNIARDVIEDKNMGRQYINHDFESIIKTIKLADVFYNSSFGAIKSIPLKYRFSIVVARRVYREIGYKIIKLKNLENYNNSGKIYISTFEKVIQTILSISDLIKISFTKVENHKLKKEHGIIMEKINLDERI